MTDRAATTATFDTVYGQMVAGDRMILADGDYSTKTLFTQTWSPRITIEAENRYGAIFPIVTSGNVSGINFVGLDLGNNPDLHSPGSSFNLDFTWCKSAGGWNANFSNNVTLTNHYHRGFGNFFDNSTDLTLDRCTFNFGTGNTSANDIIRCANNVGLTVRDCVIYDMYYSGVDLGYHADLLQMFNGQDILIEGNIFYDDPTTFFDGFSGVDAPQGIFLGGGPVSSPAVYGYSNVIIRNNLVRVNHPQAIFLGNNRGTSTIENNTVVTGAIDTFSSSGDTTIGVQDNVTPEVTSSGAGPAPTESGNIETNTVGAANVFVSTTPNDWTVFAQKSPYLTVGAVTRYDEILAGTNVEAINLLRDVGGVSWTAPGEGSPPAPTALPKVLSLGGSALYLNGIVITGLA